MRVESLASTPKRTLTLMTVFLSMKLENFDPERNRWVLASMECGANGYQYS